MTHKKEENQLENVLFIFVADAAAANCYVCIWKVVECEICHYIDNDEEKNCRE